jgi:lysophospholipase L1-like esterase
MRLLFLGDSYTIGEGVDSNRNFPGLLIEQLKKKNIPVSFDLIIAKTGWTTSELMEAINKQSIDADFNFVTLLIGVNNQYRGLDIATYKHEFEMLLEKAVFFAQDDEQSVIVISIPDWGRTPFAEGRDIQKISDEIDQYNQINQEIAAKFGVHYLNITNENRDRSNDDFYLAADKLHPSSEEYIIWAEKLLPMFLMKN